MYPLWRILLFLFPAFIVFVTLLPFYFKLKWQGELNQSLIVKGLCTLTLSIFCFNGCLVNTYIAFWSMMAGFLFYCIGDVVIEKKIHFGVAAFMVGHGFFITAFLIMAKPKPYCIPLILILLFISFILYRKPLLKMGKFAVLFLLYAAVLFTMLALTLSLPYFTGTAMMAGGTAFLTISNLLLAHNRTTPDNPHIKRNGVIYLVLYYSGLYLLALSVWM